MNEPDSSAPLESRTQQRRDLFDGIVNLEFFTTLHVLASMGAQPSQDDVGVDTGGKAAVVARPKVQHPQRVPLGGLPAVWCSGARSRPLSTNTQPSWKMCSFV